MCVHLRSISCGSLLHSFVFVALGWFFTTGIHSYAKPPGICEAEKPTPGITSLIEDTKAFRLLNSDKRYYEGFRLLCEEVAERIRAMPKAEFALLSRLGERLPNEWGVAEMAKARESIQHFAPHHRAKRAELWANLGFSSESQAWEIERLLQSNDSASISRTRALLAHATEQHNRRMRFVFFTDHSASHMRDVMGSVDRVLAQLALLPPRYASRYANFYGDRGASSLKRAMELRRDLAYAAGLHDAGMWIAREGHAEAALAMAQNMPGIGDPQQRLRIGLIALLHRSALVPGNDLAKWDRYLLPVLRGLRSPAAAKSKTSNARVLHGAVPFNDALLADKRLATLAHRIEKLSPKERETIALLAEVLRLADAHRTIGGRGGDQAAEGLVNSCGYSFSLGKHGEAVLVDGSNPRKNRELPVLASQQRWIYGQIVFATPSIGRDKRGNPAIIIPIAPGQSIDPVALAAVQAVVGSPGYARRVMAGNPPAPGSLLDWKAASMLHTINEIVVDYPAHLSQGLQVRIGS